MINDDRVAYLIAFWTVAAFTVGTVLNHLN
jgi:hypothetical protein